ncbi:UDP-glucuronosyltransferase 2A1-like isoform X1 [Spea bombifrons]|uniref:UDP-glucuronosyltransferase 2A1-like isoform X1 n=1 Tax=Spea bombifrons TaxID=233779 RepID=UPI002349E42C|nr:UDP-glucuronosyltransferase 2A1-like isoform X1 [Spea bombifrons]
MALLDKTYSLLAQMLIIQVLLAKTMFCGNILIWPAEGSHWLNIKNIIDELINRGHNVTILASSGSAYIRPSQKTFPETYETFYVPYGKEDIHLLIEQFVKLWMYEKPNITFLQFYQRLSILTSKWHQFNKNNCNSVLKSQELFMRLKSQQFNVLVSDPVTPCGELVALALGIPFMYSLRFTPGLAVERHCGKISTPPSFTPAVLSELTDRMSFSERMKNVVSYLIQDYIFFSLWREWDQYYSEILGYPTSLCEVMGKADIWLIRTYWDFEYPRPTLPNFDFVGGLHCTPAKPLPEEMEEVVQGSGDHGIVVFSLGSMVKNLSEERSNMIAAALSQLPQKVIWRYSGKKPDTLGENTIVYDWIPQNDLLGHPKTKAFITHGGTNGIYEAIYHGIPMVGIPLFADQPDNMVHMKTKGMAVMLDFNKMKTQDLVDAVNTVINDPSYKENALRISSIHHDQPIKPLDRAVFWIEFVMRHKGAKHLRPASHDLTWYQYHCLDVIGFLLVCLLTVLYISVKLFTFCCRKCCRTKKKLKTQ